MKRIAILFTLYFVSCQESYVDKLSENLKVYYSEKVKADDPLNHVDSLRIIRIDTVTQRDIFIFKANKFIRQNDNLKIELESLKDKFNTNYKMARLSSGISETLFDNYKTEALDNNKELQKTIATMKANLQKSDSLVQLSNKADSIKPIHYQTVSLLQYSRKDKSVYRDTVYTDLNIEKQIIRPEEINRQYYSLE